MQSDIELVKRTLKNAELGDMAGMGADMAEGFRFSGATPEPLNKAQFLDLMRALTAALPNWRFNISEIRETGNTVSMVNSITGKNTGVLDFPSLGINSLPATGRKVALPAEAIDVVVMNGRISEFKVTPTPGGGLMGIFSQLGIKVPAHAGAR